MQDKKPKRRTIREWVEKRRPEYDPNKHFVMLNWKPLSNDSLDVPMYPLDDIEIKNKLSQ